MLDPLLPSELLQSLVATIQQGGIILPVCIKTCLSPSSFLLCQKDWCEWEPPPQLRCSMQISIQNLSLQSASPRSSNGLNKLSGVPKWSLSSNEINSPRHLLYVEKNPQFLKQVLSDYAVWMEFGALWSIQNACPTYLVIRWSETKSWTKSKLSERGCWIVAVVLFNSLITFISMCTETARWAHACSSLFHHEKHVFVFRKNGKFLFSFWSLFFIWSASQTQVCL